MERPRPSTKWVLYIRNIVILQHYTRNFLFWATRTAGLWPNGALPEIKLQGPPLPPPYTHTHLHNTTPVQPGCCKTRTRREREKKVRPNPYRKKKGGYDSRCRNAQHAVHQQYTAVFNRCCNRIGSENNRANRGTNIDGLDAPTRQWQQL